MEAVPPGSTVTFGGDTFIVEGDILLAPSFRLEVLADVPAEAGLDNLTIDSAKFEVVYKNPSGEYLPYPSVHDITAPWIISYNGIPVPQFIPSDIELYLRQTETTAGFQVSPDIIPLPNKGETLIIPNELIGGAVRVGAETAVRYEALDGFGALKYQGDVAAGEAASFLADVGEYTLRIIPEGFAEEAYDITVERGKLTEYKPEEKIPSLTPPIFSEETTYLTSDFDMGGFVAAIPASGDNYTALGVEISFDKALADSDVVIAGVFVNEHNEPRYKEIADVYLYLLINGEWVLREPVARSDGKLVIPNSIPETTAIRVLISTLPKEGLSGFFEGKAEYPAGRMQTFTVDEPLDINIILLSPPFYSTAERSVSARTAAMVQSQTGFYEFDETYVTSGSAVLQVLELSAFSGYVFGDTDLDGVRSESELPIANVSVSLTDTMSGETQTAVTDQSGIYRFEPTAPSDIIISAETPDGFAPQGTTSYTMREGSDAEYSNDFAFIPFASIEGSAQLTSGAPYDSVNVTLVGADGAAVAQALSVGGAFKFEGLLPGKYTLNYGLDDKRFSFVGDKPVWQRSETLDVSAGSANQAESLAIISLASVNAFIYADMNANGVKDADEVRSAPVKVNLTKRGGELAQSLTVMDGNVSFEGIMPGDYTVDVDSGDSDGWVIVSDRIAPHIEFYITLTQGDVFSLGGIALVKPSSVKGRADGGNALISTELYNAADDSFAAKADLDAQGNYAFDNLMPGKYYVRIETDYDMMFADTDVAVRNFPITLLMGETVVVETVSVIAGASIEGAVWEESAPSGVHDEGEAYVAGVTVTLVNAKGDTIGQTQTDADGKYAFRRIRPEAVKLHFSLPEEFMFAGKGAGAGGSIIGKSVDHTAFSDEFNLMQAQSVTDKNVALVRASAAAGVVFLDENMNGAWDTGEPPIEGVALTLESSAGMRGGSTRAEGLFRFDRAFPGDYKLTPDLAGKYQQTTPEVAFSLTAGGLASSIIIGLSPLPSVIGDYVWLDENMNGLQDDGEQGVAGAVLSLERKTDAGWLAEYSAETDEYGRYRINGVRPGIYRITALISGGDYWPAKPVSDMPEIDSNLEFTTALIFVTREFTVSAGSRKLNQDIGVVPADAAREVGWQVQDGGAISTGEPLPKFAPEPELTDMSRQVHVIGQVWRDDDENGGYDGGEPLVEGAEIYVRWTDDAVVEWDARTLTDDLGYFTLSVPAKATLHMKFVLPSGLIFADGAYESALDIYSGELGTLFVDLPAYMPWE
jgi:protocatechuate 3,4-dioxygenase beta subunit